MPGTPGIPVTLGTAETGTEKETVTVIGTATAEIETAIAEIVGTVIETAILETVGIPSETAGILEIPETPGTPETPEIIEIAATPSETAGIPETIETEMPGTPGIDTVEGGMTGIALSVQQQRVTIHQRNQQKSEDQT